MAPNAHCSEYISRLILYTTIGVIYWKKNGFDHMLEYFWFVSAILNVLLWIIIMYLCQEDFKDLVDADILARCSCSGFATYRRDASLNQVILTPKEFFMEK